VLEGAELSARYLPAARALEVGGDWYSAIKINENQLAFVVGDVSGHGLSAATAMAPLRFSMRTLAKLGLSPAAILEHADNEIDLIEDDHYATVLVGIVDLSTRACTLASAGHPLPLVVTEDGCVQLQVPVGPPLGVHEARFSEHIVQLPANAILVAFTDGLVERRGDSIDRCTDRLRQLLTSGALSTADAAVERALVLVEDEDHEDDVAVIAVRMVTAPGQHQPPATLAIPTAVDDTVQLVGADEAD
jgi:serine phosphatase RsbU (regulator of sigma subunit)